MEAYLEHFNALPVSHQGLEMTGIFTVVWTVLFFFLHPFQKLTCNAYARLKWSQQVEWNSRVVSTVHAIFAVSAALWTILKDPTFNNPPSGSLAIASSFAGVLAASLTLSYVLVSLNGRHAKYWIYDLSITLYWWSFIGDKLMLIHHLVGIVPFFLGMYRSELIMYASMIIMTEISSPFVNNRWFFATVGWSGSQLYVINGVAMWLTFLCARILWIPYMVWDFYNNWHFIIQTLKLVWIPTMIGTAVTLALSSYWFFLITKGMLKAVGMLPGSSTKKPSGTTDSKKAD